MIRKYPNLCSPIKIGNVTFKNRMFGAPMGGTDITDNYCIGRGSLGFYELRAKGGAAAVTVSELVVHPETDASHMFHLDDGVPGSLSSFTFTADAIRRHGAIASVELSHGGRYAGSYILDKVPGQKIVKYGPSTDVLEDGVEVLALTEDQIRDIISSYGNCAKLAKRAGFEMVMIHGGHGWLINQFISEVFNHRNDQYGGSLENRCRFALEVIDSVRSAVGPGFPIEFRMSGTENMEGGYGIETGVEIAKLIEDKVDIIHVSAGSHHNGFSITHPPMFAPHGINVHLAAEIKKHVKKPVATLGGLNDPAMMEEIICSGKADIVEMARALLADPLLPNKVLENREDEIVKCMRCFTCMSERVQTQTRRCTLNPMIGREIEGLEITPASKIKRVLVVGGGPGGLEAAWVAAKRGHKVILCEKEAELGGIPNCERDVEFKREMFEFSKTMSTLLIREGVEIRLNTQVTSEYAKSVNADVLICAVGSEPIVPPLPGINGENVVVVNNIPAHNDKIGQRIVVLGGGLAGCETAVHFAAEGKEVAVVEMMDAVAPDANVRHRPILMAELKSCTVRTGMKGLRVTNEGLVCADKEGQEVLLPADTVICAVGQRALRSVVEELLDSAPRVIQIGDCVRPQTMTTAIYQGYHSALDV